MSPRTNPFLQYAVKSGPEPSPALTDDEKLVEQLRGTNPTNEAAADRLHALSAEVARLRNELKKIEWASDIVEASAIAVDALSKDTP